MVGNGLTESEVLEIV